MTPVSVHTPRLAGPWQRRLVALTAILLSVTIVLPLATRLEPVLGDFLVFHFLDRNSQTRDDIVIVTITEETLADFPYRSPIDRDFLADLIATIDAAGPRAIGLDILLDVPSDPVKDQHLFDRIDAASAPVVLAIAGETSLLTERQRDYLGESVLERTHGSIMLQRDETDGVLRHLPSAHGLDGKPVDTFTDVLAGADAAGRRAKGRILYQFSPESGTTAFPRYPAHSAALLPPDWFAGKFVLIGTDLPNIDQHPTPMVSFGGTASGTLPGIAIHAQILAQILSGRTLETASLPQTVALMILTALATAIMFSLFKQPGRFFALLALMIAAYELGTYALATSEALLLPVLAPPAVALCCALVLALWRWRMDRSERLFLKTAFSRYVSPAVVNRLSSGDLRLSAGGEKRIVTYVFTDLEGFTTLSETLPADRVAELLNRYLDRMCDLMTEHGATIDKIIGDAVVGFFGAPETDPDQTSRAVGLALAMDAFCESFRTEIAIEGTSLGVTRIGIHCGEALIGNFGGRRFFDYTGIGDTVNTAARLEGANRYLGTRICVSGNVVSTCEGIRFRPVGDIVLKGRAEPVSCFEPVSEESGSAPWFVRYLSAYQQMANGDPQATTTFQAVAQLNPDDGPTRLHLNRLRDGAVGAKVVLAGK